MVEVAATAAGTLAVVPKDEVSKATAQLAEARAEAKRLRQEKEELAEQMEGGGLRDGEKRIVAVESADATLAYALAGFKSFHKPGGKFVNTPIDARVRRRRVCGPGGGRIGAGAGRGPRPRARGGGCAPEASSIGSPSSLYVSRACRKKMSVGGLSACMNSLSCTTFFSSCSTSSTAGRVMAYCCASTRAM